MVIVSLLLHGVLIIGLFVSFAKRIDFPLANTPIVPVDLVTVAEQTNIAPQAAPEPVAPPQVQMLEPAPRQIVAPKFEIAPEAKPAKPKPAKDQYAALLEKLTANPPVDAKRGARAIQGVGTQTSLTADLASVLFSQIYRCWSPDMGAPDAASYVITYEVVLNKDGTVARTALRAAAGPPSSYRDAASSTAGRAVYACQPYRLPPDRYNDWRDFTINFDPRYLTGQ